MGAETRYMRYDNHTINGLTANQLKTTQTTTMGEDNPYSAGDIPLYWAWDIIKRTSAGAETTIGSKVAVVSRGKDGEGLQSATWNCPLTTLVSTDAIRAICYVSFDGGSTWQAVGGYSPGIGWITEQLEATSLPAVTWTIYTYTRRYFDGDDTESFFQWGNSTHNTRIEGFAWAAGVAYTQTISETLGMADSIPAPKAAFKIAVPVESLGMLDTVAKRADFKKAAVDSLGMVDSLVPKGTFHWTVSDSLGMVDSAARARGQTVTVSDILGMSDTVSTKAAFKQAVSEVLGMLDSAWRGFPLKVTISEILGMRDRVETRKHRIPIGDLPDDTITGGA